MSEESSGLTSLCSLPWRMTVRRREVNSLKSPARVRPVRRMEFWRAKEVPEGLMMGRRAMSGGEEGRGRGLKTVSNGLSSRETRACGATSTCMSIPRG